ncbi:transcriptional regulator [Aureimonas endophytica]|uniref:Transcriptional regulator n=1 Tax=Aureimonas endophytica TaxID=2027858 RepID=A0A916ZIS5_9HYPH|nr:sugar-binding transcriptional regulator [Aureimonas endophytica]GGD98576.1 transcriptional regulator [Aureimonas endophytica]
MAKLRRAQNTLSDDPSLRLRAAWLYYNHNRTQKEIAEQLGLSRTTVIRLLDEGLKRGEVQIWIGGGDRDCTELALRLEEKLGLDEAIVVPEAPDIDRTARSVGLALGRFLSEAIADDMRIGVGWGRTLTASLASFRPPRRENVTVVSLLGGIMETRLENPADYAWRLASPIGADCFLFPAPLFVDSAETKRTLRERCGLDRLETLAERLDLAVVSVGDIGLEGTSLSRNFLSKADYEDVVAAGAICDVMCNFLDAEGRTVPHPVNDRVMSIDLAHLAQAEHLVLACGGAHRAGPIRAAIRRLGCNTLVTDEGAARALLASA